MDISKWPIEKIMQLPEACFGRKSVISFSPQYLFLGTSYLMSSLALADKAVLWEMSVFANGVSFPGGSASGAFSFAFGDKVPASAAEFDLMEPLIFGLNEVLSTTRVMRVPVEFHNMRYLVKPQGRKVVGYFQNASNDLMNFSANLVFSAVPREIPDFYAGFPEDKFDEMIRLMRIGVKFR